ncbi:sodium:proton antiporter, partial [Halobacteriales archaeon SW_7_68_16]
MTGEDTTVIARTVVRLVVPLALMTALALLFQGHNLPGGGFIAGVLTVVAAALLYVVFGIDYIEGVVLRRGGPVGVDGPAVEAYRRLVALGLATAITSGLVAVAFDSAFLGQTFVILHGLPIYGELELASALAFDVGVYLVVVGGLLAVVAVVG